MTASAISEEHQYLNLITTILLHGHTREDRTKTGTISVFAPPQLRFSLQDGTYPLLTTKQVFHRGVLEELLWFLKGSTNGQELSAKGIKIWEGNGSRDALDKLGFSDRAVGDLGPVYGFQWRHFGAEYHDCDRNYQGEGVDQLCEVVNLIRNDPCSRRIILTAWNPSGCTERHFFLIQIRSIAFSRFEENVFATVSHVLSILR